MPYVYILTNKPNGSLYIGSTVNLTHRIEQHKTGKGSIHTSRYNLKRLVWVAEFENLDDAKAQEARMKVWKRAWKIEAIEELNPTWRDLSEDF